jgi:hypothetical protein
MPLSNTKIAKLKPKRRAYKESDEKGLYLYITPSGGKLWRLKYRFGGKEKVLSFGKYPEITLKQARDKRDEAKSTLANDIDPSELKQQQKRARIGLSGSSFEVVTREWVAKFSTNWSPVYSERLIGRFERNVFPWIGSYECNDITPPILLSVLRRIEHRGALETAHRTKQSCGQAFRYAIATGRCERDPSADLKGALPPAKKTHFATITDAKGIGTLLRAVNLRRNLTHILHKYLTQ